MGILGNLFGGNGEDDGYSDFGTRLALAGQVLSAMDRGQSADIAPSLAILNERRRKYADQIKTSKWLKNQAASMADKNPRMAQMLQDENLPPEVGQGLIAEYYKTLLAPPDWKTFESGGDIYRYNPLDPASKPEMFFDGPEDPFKQMINGVLGKTGASAAGAPPAAPGATPAAPGGSEAPAPMPGAQASELPPMLKTFAQAYALPNDVTPEEVMSVAQAGAIGGKDQAAATAEAIRKRYADKQTQGFEATKEQTANAFKLQDDYWRVGQKYQPIIDTANEIASLPDDPNGFERLMTLYKFMRSLDPAGAVRESDANMAQNASGPQAQLDQLFQKYSGVSGGDIPLDAAKEMKRLILQIGEITSQADYKAKRRTLQRADKMGIPADKAEQMIFGSLSGDVDMSGYTPRFQVPARPETDPTDTGAAKTEPGAPVPPKPGDWTDLDPAKMTEGKEYPGENGNSYMKRNGKVWENDGSGWKEFNPNG